MSESDFRQSHDQWMALFLEIATRNTLPDVKGVIDLLNRAMVSLSSDDSELRPRDQQGRPGGLLHLKKDIPVVLIPDLHGRSQLLLSVLSYQFQGRSILSHLLSDEIQILCLGDAFHTEVSSQENWLRAFKEYQGEFSFHESMDREMILNFRTLELILHLKSGFGGHFHFLKGNHENIANGNDNGNYPFGKYAHEGEMVRSWCQRFYGDEMIQLMSQYEMNLPLLATGHHFMASHAEPEEYFDPEIVINYRDNPQVVYGLTWTTNDRDRLSSVWRMLETYLGDEQPGIENLYFGGHRHITGRYHLRSGRRFVQIHNPEKYIMALIRTDRAFELDRDILELE